MQPKEHVSAMFFYFILFDTSTLNSTVKIEDIVFKEVLNCFKTQI